MAKRTYEVWAIFRRGKWRIEPIGLLADDVMERLNYERATLTLSPPKKRTRSKPHDR